jgi:hypothetical protein
MRPCALNRKVCPLFSFDLIRISCKSDSLKMGSNDTDSGTLLAGQDSQSEQSSEDSGFDDAEEVAEAGVRVCVLGMRTRSETVQAGTFSSPVSCEFFFIFIFFCKLKEKQTTSAFFLFFFIAFN